MLVLSRKLNEEIIIAGNIRVKILEINGNRIRLGVSAPTHVPVVREEIYVPQGRHAEDRLELSPAGK